MMTDRVGELFGQALDIAVPGTWTTISYDQLMKIKTVFAVMLIHECLDTAIDTVMDDKHYGVATDIISAFVAKFGEE